MRLQMKGIKLAITCNLQTLSECDCSLSHTVIAWRQVASHQATCTVTLQSKVMPRA